MRRIVALAVLVSLSALGCAGGSAPSAKYPAPASPSATPPVALAGKVNDHGTKKLGPATEVEIEADDFYFAPTFVSAAAGSAVRVVLKNEGKAGHTFTIDGAGVDQALEPGSTKTVRVQLPSSGSLTFYCRFHRASGMQGAFVIAGRQPAP